MVNKVGLRERNKKDKLIRIKAAAGQLFTEHGFDGTTTRMIAEKADVALATLFLYATDKRDLLFLVCNDDLDKLTTDAFSDVPEDESLLEQFTICFRHFFIFYGRNRNLSRDLLRELTFYTSGKQSQIFQEIRLKNIELIEDIVSSSQRKRRIKSTEDAGVIARMVFYLLAAELRMWLSQPDSSPEAGVQFLRSMLSILIKGLGPKKGDI